MCAPFFSPFSSRLGRDLISANLYSGSNSLLRLVLSLCGVLLATFLHRPKFNYFKVVSLLNSMMCATGAFSGCFVWVFFCKPNFSNVNRIYREGKTAILILLVGRTIVKFDQNKS